MAEVTKETESKKEYIVDGFLFLSEEDAAAAREELKKARYLERHLDYQGADMILQLYRKALKERTFQTPVGLAFVNELRGRLIEAGIEEFDIEPIPVYYDVVQNKMRSGFEPVKEEPAPEPKKEWTKLAVSVFFNVFLALLVAGMFFVAMTGNNPNILNYQNAVLNKYAAWEQELTEREQAVREKEQELGIE
ncbi:MAG: hypothetical protein HFI11_12335 [Lachnospiraceae bacterium]|jgi:hypothetical protein|nr:hypothetical protein [Lachnospiraceae bacterium]